MNHKVTAGAQARGISTGLNVSPFTLSNNVTITNCDVSGVAGTQGSRGIRLAGSNNTASNNYVHNMRDGIFSGGPGHRFLNNVLEANDRFGISINNYSVRFFFDEHIL